MGRKERVDPKPGRGVDAEVVMVTFTCPACDKQAKVIKGKKLYRCTFCSTETTRKVAKEAGCLTSPNLKAAFEALAPRKKISATLDLMNRHRLEPTKSSGPASRSKKKKSSSRT